MKEGAIRLNSFLFRGAAGKSLLAVLLLCAFLAGYATTSDVARRCAAQSWPLEYADLLMPPIGMSSIPCPPCGPAPPTLCDVFGLSSGVAAATLSTLQAQLMVASAALQIYIGDWLIDGMVNALLEILDQAELNLIDWWDTFWFYNLYPALQDMTKQFSVSLAEEVRTLQASVDSQGGNASTKARVRQELDAVEKYAPNENVAVVATLVGGQVRAATMGRALRNSMQNTGLATGMAKSGTPAAAGSASAGNARNRSYETLFCDPRGNAGRNNCAASNPAFYNADTQITKYVFNNLTLDITGSAAPPAP